MRISTQLTQDIGVNAMLKQQSKIAKSQVQLASGLRVNTPSDDAPAAVRALLLKESIQTTQQYQTNVTMAKSRLSQEEGALDGIVTVMQRLNELALQGNNDSLTASDRHAIEVEARQILSQVQDLVNTKTDGGEYLFSGFVSTTPPYAYQPYITGTPPTEVGGVYVYQGDTNRHSTMVAPTYRVQDSDPGSEVFNIDIADFPGTPPTTVWPPAVPAGVERPWVDGSVASDPPVAAPPEANILNVIYNFAENMGNDTPDSMDIERIQRAMTAVENTRITIGGRLQALDSQESLNLKFTTDQQGYLSTTQDLDYTAAISKFNLQTVALQAAQQAYAKVQGLSLFNYLS